ncbi:MAG: flagellar biosynthesis protein FlhF, partial [Caldimonas sp.]
MNVKRFTARTSREALRQVRETLGEDAVILSTKPAGAGVEVLAMAPEGMRQVEQLAAEAPAGALRAEPAAAPTSVEQDVVQMQMSTLSFQDYVRTRMLKRRKAAMEGEGAPAPAFAATPVREPGRARTLDVRIAEESELATERSATPSEIYAAAAAASRAPADLPLPAESRADSRILEQRMADGAAPVRAPATPPVAADPIRHSPSLGEHVDVLAELRSMKGLIEERFGALAFMEKLQRRPAEARLTQKLLDCGFSPALIRKLSEGLTAEVGDETAWATQVLERNLHAHEGDSPLEEQGGVFALIGATGVGKTTTTAKIAAAFAARHGAASLGLVTLDAYRVGAHEQLRAYGRILGVPVHTAHDRASLEDLLELLGAKKMVLIDTAGMAQRDSRTRELLEMLSHRSIQRLLVVSAASQGETIEDVIVAYKAATCAGVVLSKIDEAVKLGPALDAAIRHKLKIVGVAN